MDSHSEWWIPLKRYKFHITDDWPTITSSQFAIKIHKLKIFMCPDFINLVTYQCLNHTIEVYLIFAKCCREIKKKTVWEKACTTQTQLSKTKLQPSLWALCTNKWVVVSDMVCNPQYFPWDLLSQYKQVSELTTHRPPKKPHKRKEVRGGTEDSVYPHIPALSQWIPAVVQKSYCMNQFLT